MKRLLARIAGLKLKRAMDLVVALPLSLALLLAADLLWLSFQDLREAEMADEAVVLAVGISDLLHQTQRERGTSAMFLNDGTDRFANDLEGQRFMTDGSLTDTAAAIAAATPFWETRGVGKEIAALNEKIAGLVDLRAKVDKRRISPPEAFAQFNALNRAGLDVIRVIGVKLKSPTVKSKIAALSSLAEAKEVSGQERATGAGAFAAGRFDIGTVLKIERMVALQEANLDQFESRASAGEKTALDMVRTGKANDEVKRMRAILAGALIGGGGGGVKPEQFFDAKSQQIEALKGVENGVARTLKEMVVAERRAGWREFGMIAALILGGLGISVVISRRVAAAIAGGIGTVEGAARRMAAGELDLALPAAGANEAGAIIAALDAFRNSIREGQQREAELAEAEATARSEREAAERARFNDETRRAREAAETASRLRDAEQAAAAEVSAVVDRCAQGDFSHRLSLDDKDGVFRALAEGLNRIGTTTNDGLQDIRRVAQALAVGDLTARMRKDLPGVFAEIGQAVDAMGDSLAQAMGQIRGATVSVDNASDEISRAAEDLARRSEHNAATLEQTVAALEVMAQTVRASASAATDARASARDIAQKAGAGGAVVTAAVTAMGRIEASSGEMAGIITIIEEIAFQTSLLALNASVEAARAGESGRAFSLVATEVRELASRAAAAAKDISNLIGKSREQVLEGVACVNETGAVLTTITGGVQEIAVKIEQIAGSAGEIASGVNELSRAAGELDTATQRNAAMFEETNAAVQNLRTEARSLASTVEGFRLSPARANASASRTHRAA